MHCYFGLSFTSTLVRGEEKNETSTLRANQPTKAPVSAAQPSGSGAAATATSPMDDEGQRQAQLISGMQQLPQVRRGCDLGTEFDVARAAVTIVWNGDIYCMTSPEEFHEVRSVTYGSTVHYIPNCKCIVLSCPVFCR